MSSPTAPIDGLSTNARKLLDRLQARKQLDFNGAWLKSNQVWWSHYEFTEFEPICLQMRGNLKSVSSKQGHSIGGGQKDVMFIFKRHAVIRGCSAGPTS